MSTNFNQVSNLFSTPDPIANTNPNTYPTPITVNINMQKTLDIELILNKEKGVGTLPVYLIHMVNEGLAEMIKIVTFLRDSFGTGFYWNWLGKTVFPKTEHLSPPEADNLMRTHWEKIKNDIYDKKLNAAKRFQLLSFFVSTALVKILQVAIYFYQNRVVGNSFSSLFTYHKMASYLFDHSVYDLKNVDKMIEPEIDEKAIFAALRFGVSVVKNNSETPVENFIWSNLQIFSAKLISDEIYKDGELTRSGIFEQFRILDWFFDIATRPLMVRAYEAYLSNPLDFVKIQKFIDLFFEKKGAEINGFIQKRNFAFGLSADNTNLIPSFVITEAKDRILFTFVPSQKGPASYLLPSQ